MSALPSERQGLLPAGADLPAVVLVLVGLLAAYAPEYLELSRTIWRTDEQGHGPIIFVVSLWLLYNLRHTLAELPSRPAGVSAAVVLLLGSLLYVVGRSQDIWIFSIGSQIWMLAGLALLFKGWRGLRVIWFPLFFMIFMVPLPEALVASVTAPLKMAVSYVASNLLYGLGLPVGRSGVTLTVGQYQLLVADACAGLNSMFTLEALGMLYMNLMRYTSVARNVTLALTLVPIAFCANIGRVMILVLVTYFFGDAAGQGFVHGFAGMVLFMLALMLMLLVDKLLNLFFKPERGAAKGKPA
ncbi:exosortase B [Pelomonas saccharophila]|uniref:Exosortase B n=1 Tax=Roseateles saccharophilus TaxID=304 RepID=A0ABU1YSS4_ROSSA|nr:exosortase B [Roseateles saccharophilus]MDR7271783.1 exosortase B [Roseateles saccharophilus]